jgi:hypothetical protein
LVSARSSGVGARRTAAPPPLLWSLPLSLGSGNRTCTQQVMEGGNVSISMSKGQTAEGCKNDKTDGRNSQFQTPWALKLSVVVLPAAERLALAALGLEDRRAPRGLVAHVGESHAPPLPPADPGLLQVLPPARGGRDAVRREKKKKKKKKKKM